MDPLIAGERPEKVRVLKGRALALLRGNLKRGYDPYYRREYQYVCPSTQKYLWQWFWDSCFHAISLSHLDMELAKNELLSLVVSQEPDGFIGHVTFWRGARKGRTYQELWRWAQSKLAFRLHHSALIQPPLLAQAVRKVYERSQDASFLKEIFPSLERYYRWLATHRDPDGDGLIAIISNYESGLDHSPAYDQVLGLTGARPRRWQLERKGRGLDLSNLVLGRNYNLRRIFALDRFNVEDVMVNCIYAEALYDMAELARQVGARESGREFHALAQKAEAAILTKCYDQETGAYYNLCRRQEYKSRALTFASLFPIILPNTPREPLDSLVRLHLQDPQEFWLPFPVPSVARSEPSFEPEPRQVRFPMIWRGPTWINVNWFLVRGLSRHGYQEIASYITDRSLELVLREGFREFYNPLTGRALGAPGFGWSTLVVDMVE